MQDHFRRAAASSGQRQSPSKIPARGRHESQGHLLTIRHVCERLHISRSYAYHLVHTGKLRCFYIRKMIRIHPDDLAQYIADRERMHNLVFGPGKQLPVALTKAAHLDMQRLPPFKIRKRRSVALRLPAASASPGRRSPKGDDKSRRER